MYDTKARIKKVFRDADANYDGVMSRGELQALMMKLGSFSSDEVDTMFSKMDTNGDGTVDYEEFVDWVLAGSTSAADPDSPETHLANLAETGYSAGEFVKPSFKVPERGAYAERTLPDDGSWQDLLKKHSADNPFEDTVFGHNERTLIREKDGEAAGFVKATVGWKRIWELSGEKTFLFRKGASAADIDQGNLGDCYFLSALATVANSPAFMARLFPGEQEVNAAGVYAVRFWRDGEYRIVVVDDYLPVRKDGRLVMAGSDRNTEFWVCIAEKAWAKLNGSYRAIKGGQEDRAMWALTGVLFPKSFTLRPYRGDADDRAELFEMLKSSLAKGSLAGAGSKGKWENGIAPCHAYSVLGFHEVQVKGATVRLVCVRNPWGSGKEWTGAYRDGDAAWGDVDDADKARLGVKDAKDGVFFMTFDDWCETFYLGYLAEGCRATEASLYRVTSEVADGTDCWVHIHCPTRGAVKTYSNTQDSMGLYDEEDPTVVSRIFRTSCSADTVSHSDLKQIGAGVQGHKATFDATAAAGESIVLRVHATKEGGESRVYIMVRCPTDAKVTVFHDGLGGKSQVAVEGAEEEPAEDMRSLTCVVHDVGVLAGWDDEDASKVVTKLQRAGVCNALDWMRMVLDGSLNDKMEAGRKFSKKTMKHMKAIASNLKDLQDAVKSMSGETGWDDADQDKVVFKLVSCSICEVDSLVSVIRTVDLNNKLKAAGFKPFGVKSSKALKAWAKGQTDAADSDQE